MLTLLNLVWIIFMYFFVKENNKKTEYQSNPILYALLTFEIGFFGALGFYYGNKFNKEDKVPQKFIGYGVGIFFTMINILVLFV